MYGKSEKLDEYIRDTNNIEKREQTKAELKVLLKQYIRNPDHNTECSSLVGYA